MNEDLKWLAKNVHEWPRHDVTGIGLDPDGEFRAHGVGCELDYFPDPAPEGLTKRVGMNYTRSQWQSARDELSGKPSWDDAPEWANWLAQDFDGWWLWFEVEPNHVEKEWADECFINPASKGIVLGDWRNTLEQRPCVSQSTEYDKQKEFSAVDGRQWRGPDDGLPPVGSCCEMRFSSGVWQEVKIEHYTREYVVFTDMCGCERVEYIHSFEFRPIRTEEDKAVEELQDIICFDGFISKDGTLSLKIAKLIYAAGYRKQESK